MFSHADFEGIEVNAVMQYMHLKKNGKIRRLICKQVQVIL